MDVAKADSRAQQNAGRAALKMALKPKPVDFDALETGLFKELLGLDEARETLYGPGVHSEIGVRLADVQVYSRRLPNEPGMPNKGVPNPLLMGERGLSVLMDESVPFLQSNARGTYRSHAAFEPHVTRYNPKGGEIVQYAFRERDGMTHRLVYVFGTRLAGAEFGNADAQTWTRWATDGLAFSNMMRPLIDVYGLVKRKMEGATLEEMYEDASGKCGLHLCFELAP